LILDDLSCLTLFLQMYYKQTVIVLLIDIDCIYILKNVGPVFNRSRDGGMKV